MHASKRQLSFRPLLQLVMMSCALVACAHPPAGSAIDAPVARLAAGDGTFEFTGWAGPALRVWHHVPIGVTDSTPIVFVMHGKGRDADRYRNEWSALAEANHFILAVPEFDDKRFPGGDSYNRGGFQDKAGRVRPRDQWTFAAIEPLFDAVRARTGSKVETYAIYGHSAGAQFVHRFALFMPDARYHAAVSGNAGAYALPDFAIDYPFGLGKSPVNEAVLRRVLAKPMVVLLGTADIDPNHQSLPREPEAMAQGPYRLARGRTFYAAAKAKAAELGVPFGWQLRYAEGVGHKNGEMAAFAAPFLGKPAAQ